MGTSPPHDLGHGHLRSGLGHLLDSVDTDWAPLLGRFRSSPEGRHLIEVIDARVAAGAIVFPADPFRALRLTPLASTSVVLVGQDPYHGRGQAEGLAFSVPPGARIPPSLRNIHKELARDLGCPVPASGHLGPWASRGVLLLNAVLTVEEGVAGSHAKLGWERLTADLIDACATDDRPKAFLLWGAHAQVHAPRIRAASPRHLLLQSNHPSPLSAARPPVPFVGCGHFGQVRAFLAEQGRPDPWEPADA